MRGLILTGGLLRVRLPARLCSAARAVCFRALCLTLVLVGVSPAAHSLTHDLAVRMAIGETASRLAALRDAVDAGDAATAGFLRQLVEGNVRVAEGRAFIVQGGRVLDAVTGAASEPVPGADEPVINNRMRREIAGALGALALFVDDRAQRLSAAQAFAKSADASRLPLLERALGSEKDAQIRSVLEGIRSGLLLAAPERDRRLAAAAALSRDGGPSAKALLSARLVGDVEPDAQVREAVRQAIARIDARLAWYERLGLAFAGISLGSILLLAALGLAITYGLMGVINMAHGELMMIGAYATWMVQNAFRAWAPQWFDAYLLAAVPVSFIVAALVGAALERSVIRFLYGRPLETLLATWGISLVLIQAARTLFGAQNVTVENPAWMSGGVTLAANLVLPWNRIVIIGFAVLVLLGVGLVLARTRLGLFVRAATQNRTMARCVGVPTRRVDTMAFALGSGIAGLAGCALSQIGNVGPDLGQAYIIDSFMVVVLGGVGQLAGAVSAAMGLGIVNKLIEGLSGPVIAKIAVLLFIVGFIQKRPQGLFALRGRSAEA